MDIERHLYDENSIREDEGDTIKENDYIIIDIEKNMTLARIEKDKSIRILKSMNIQSNSLIGHSYGSSFQMNDQGYVEKVEGSVKFQTMIIPEAIDQFGDGSSVFDTNKAQLLTDKDIEKLKNEGESGENIVKQIVASSSSFNSKTQFSQQKYIKRKSKKYVPIFTILKPTSHTLCDYYYQKAPAKIFNIRSDVLAQLLYFASLSHDSKVLLFESAQGLLSGSILQRLSSEGLLVQLYKGNTLSNRIIQEFCASINIGRYEKYSTDIPDFYNMMIQKYSRYFTSLIIASKYSPFALFKFMIPFLMNSSPFVVYCNIIEPLKDIYRYIKDNQMSFDVYISDTFYREMQVIHEMTHPKVNMDGRGGFILRGIYIEHSC